jgi:GR25 family glycosyltransferase involved in LPS biosynthesis
MELIINELINSEEPKLCLNMIVKNESHIIKDTLDKLLQKVPIDYWVISDTGSTDNTKEIIIDFFKEKNIKGELFVDEWKDFGYNRTKALEHAYGKSKYLLIIDADDEIHGDFVLPDLKMDSYFIQYGDVNGTSYVRPQIVNNKKKWMYYGVLHEALVCRENTNGDDTISGNYYTISGRTSSRNQDKDKYLKDALILEKAYEEAFKNKAEIYNRYGFYCANSYYDYGKYEEAIKWYKITLDNNNWVQEKYVSCLKLYNCYNVLNQKETGFFYLVKSFSYDKERVECLCELLSYYCINGMNDIAYGYYNIVKPFYNEKYLKYNLQSKLFLDVSKANFILPYYMILIADKMHDFDTIIQMYKILFIKKHIFSTQQNNNFFIGNMLYNLQFFIERTKNDKEFMNLFKEYIDFLISLNYPVYDYDFMVKYEIYGIIKPKLDAPLFTQDECFKSNKILFYTGYSPFKWNYTYSLTNALGGSETAAISLSQNFPKNYQIYIAGAVEEETIDNIKYVNLNNLNNLIKTTAFHTIIVSRYLNFYELYQNFSSYQTFIWGHDIVLFPYGTNLSVENIIKKWSPKINGCVCQTEWHKNLFISLYPELKEKMRIINNGINPELFTFNNKKVMNKFVYTSCSERGLDRLLELWPTILENLPDAELFIASYNNFPNNDYEIQLKTIIDSYSNIKHVGKLNKNELYDLMKTAEYWLYPTNFNETSCITSMEMLMSEVICIYYPIAGLVNTLGDYGIPVKREQEVETIINLTNKKKNEIKRRGKEYALSCSWKNRAKQWLDLITKDSHNSFDTETNENKYNIKIINLKKRTDRKEHIEQQLKEQNILNYTFSEAIDGKELKESEELRLLFERNDFNYRKGVIGCSLSHINLWHDLINDSDNKCYIILEDDIQLCKNFKEKLDFICEMFIKQEIEHLALGDYTSNRELNQDFKKLNIIEKDVYCTWNTAFSYIISKNAAKKIITYINNCSIKAAIDNPQAYGNIIKYSELNESIIRCVMYSENLTTDIQLNEKDNCLVFSNNIKNNAEVSISFCDWWNAEYCGGVFDFNNNLFTSILNQYGNIKKVNITSPDSNPDILFYSIFGSQHINYKAGRKIFFSGEPYGARKEADYNLTFDDNSNKNTRLPLWLSYFSNSLLNECNKRKNGLSIIPQREKFCSFIATGPGLANNRQEFVEKLSKYKRVDCGGSYLNNIGYNVPVGLHCSGKIEHNNSYKFAVAFESTVYPGYVTEKICDIYKSNCIPIYWGHPNVIKDFNPTTFINANDFSNFDELIKYIIKVDNNEDLYKSFFKEPMLKNIWLDIFSDPNKTFYKNLADCIIGKNTKLYDNFRNVNNKLDNIIETVDCLKENTAYICGCVKNCEQYLPKVFDNIKNLITLFERYKIVIAYDNSTDNTYNYLIEMRKIYNIEIINCNNNCNIRVENICNARNSILQYIRSTKDESYEYLIMMDLDNVSCEKMNTDVIKYYLNRNDWDSLSFNPTDYYDIFALSIKPYIHSCWHWKNEEDTQVTEVVTIMRNYVKEKLSSIEKTDLLDCFSAFNGFAIYKTEKFNNCNYSCDHSYNMDFLNKNMGNNWLENNINALNNKYKLRFDEKQDCEHRIFHLEAIYKNNAKIMISPLSIFDFSDETNHLIKNNTYNTALIIEPRDDDDIIDVIFDFNNKLNKDSHNWQIVFYCGKNLKTKWMSIFKDINIEIRELNTNNLTQNEYSDFCKNKELWESLYGKFVLVFQLDTIIRNEEPYTVDYFTKLNKSYIGGNMYYNWDELTRENIHINIRNFNGGLSLRKRLDMIKIIKTFNPENTIRPSYKMQTDPEDVYFTIGCYRLKLEIGDDEPSSFFAVHTIIKEQFFGCHNPCIEIKQKLLDIYPHSIKNKICFRKIIEYNIERIKKKFNFECNRISDINEHLITLYNYAKECESIIECGVRSCVSSWAFGLGLIENNKDRKNILLNDIDKCDIHEFLKLTKNTDLNVNYKWCSDLDLKIENQVDMVFIDTFHVYGQLKKELAKFSKLTNKYIIMHDTTIDEFTSEAIRANLSEEEINTLSANSGLSVDEIKMGLWPAIEEFLQHNSEWTLHERYTNNNGLTILKKTNKTNKKIIDCFTFYNELELLKYRLTILNEYVDYFVLVEATHSHVGKEKPLFYQENKELFKEFNDKIIHIVVDDFSHRYPNINIANNEQWINERFQRTCIKRGLDKLKLNDDDIFTVTDLDEIPDPNIFEKIKKNEIFIEAAIIELDLYYYNLNSKLDNKWRLSKIMSYKKYKELNISCEEIRQNMSFEIIPNAGWHLSYFGNEKFIKNKIENFGHQEVNLEDFTNENKISSRIKNKLDLYDRPISIINIEIKDNIYLPPKYDIYLTPFLT